MTFGRLPLRRVVVDACDGPFGSSLKSEHYSDSGARVVRLGNIGNGEWNDDDAAFLPLDYWETLSRHHAMAGDLLVAGLGDENHALGRACVMPDLGPALVKADCYRLRLDPTRADPKFVALYLSSPAGGAEALRLAEGSTRSRLTLGKALSIPFPDVPLREQRAIADYLDAETARIDAVTSRRMLMIRLVEEWEQARLVCLLGDWRTIATANLRQLRTTVVTGPFGTQLAASEYTQGGVPVINPTHIGDGRLTPDPEVAVPPDVAGRLIRHRLDAGDIVMGRKGDVGRAAVVGPVESGWICGSDSIAIRTESGRLLPEFLAMALRTDYYRQQLAAQSTGAMVASVNEPILLAFRVPSVPLDEQKRIVEAGREAQRSRARIVDLLREQAERMNERRQALITAAVTGQLDIPGVAA